MSYAHTVDGITVTYLGRTEWAQNERTMISESPDGGLDTLTLNFIGAPWLRDAFIESLAKGSAFSYNGENYYLTHWTDGGDDNWPELALHYAGLSDGTPDPIGDDDVSVQSITVTGTTSEGGETITLERTIDYLAFQTTWRYIANSRPTSALVGVTSTGINPTILRSVITVSGGENNGKRYGGANAPAAYVVATTPGVADMVLSLRATEVYGTPFFPVEEVVARMFFG